MEIVAALHSVLTESVNYEKIISVALDMKKMKSEKNRLASLDTFLFPGPAVLISINLSSFMLATSQNRGLMLLSQEVLLRISFIIQ